ncbi:MAG: rRNA pseudouridine synthase [Bacteroidaceae bacterium]|nr:rRNA pseudouridine synthase [Bacteroidaceae bacterium]
MSTEDEIRNDGLANTEGQNSNREGYKPYNRDNNRGYSTGRPRFNSGSSYSGDHSTYNRGGGERRPRFSSSQRAYSSNAGSFRPASFGAEEQRPQQQREYRPRFNPNQEGGYQPRERNSYNNRGGQGGYSRGGYNNEGGSPQRGGYSRGPQQGGYNRGGQGGFSRGGYNNEGGSPQRGGYSRGPQQGGYNRGGQGGFNRGGNQRPRTADYNPNAKYSHKKQLEYHDALLDPNAPIRLNKFMANAGLCSRREADEFITAGVVSVNGVVVTELGTKVLPTDEVKFHEDPVKLEHKVYVLLNKPKDYVTTTDDPEARKTVMQLVAGACKERIYPVGRLDRNTTGVLLLTNDGDLASKLTHPKFLKKKVYHVHLDRNVAHSDLVRIAEGLTLDDGEVHADAVSYASETDKSQVGIEIHSGKNRIVRRIFEHLGYRVTKLDRVLFAGLTKKNLRRGDWRYLTETEVNMLRMGAFE